MIFVALLLAADSTAPPTTNERTQVERASKRCGDASQDAVNLRFKEALEGFEEALRAYSLAPLSDDERAVAWDCAVKWGAAAIESDRAQDALEAFTLAMLLEPAKEPSAKAFNPKAIATFNKAKQRRRAHQTSGLTVTGSPQAAEVWIDGRYVGRLPLSLSKLTAGVHWLLVRAPDHDPFATPLTLKPNDAYRSEAFLKSLVTTSAPVAVKPAAPPLATTQERSTSQPVAIVSAPPAKTGVHPGLSWLPFGVPQFLERRYAVGAVLLATQVALIALNATLYAIASRDKAADGYFNNPDRTEAMKWVVNGTFIAVGIDMIAGGIDGIVHRND